MAQICINKSTKAFNIYRDYGGGMKSSGVIGVVNPRELHVIIGTESGYTAIGFYSPSGWRIGYIEDYHTNMSVPAYTQSYAHKRHKIYGNMFKILHRQSRIFSGTNVVAAVQPGGYVVAKVGSIGGTDFPYRLSIVGYMHANSDKFISVTNGWCDTDIEIGKCMYNTVTVDGLWY